jgi:hypothetical protein
MRVYAAQLLSNTDSDPEAQWLAMSTEGASAVVRCNMEGLHEVDLFCAVERWHRPFRWSRTTMTFRTTKMTIK